MISLKEVTRVGRTFAGIVCICIMTVSFAACAKEVPVPSFRLLTVIPISKLHDKTGKPITRIANDEYGFSKGGKELYLKHDLVIDLATGKQSTAYPSDFSLFFIGREGRFIYGVQKDSKTRTSKTLVWDTIENRESNLIGLELESGLTAIHPDGVSWANVEPKTPDRLRLTIRNGLTGQSSHFDINFPWQSMEIGSFSDDGRFLSLRGLPGFFLDAKQMKAVPLDAEFDPINQAKNSYVGRMETFVYSRDASLVAGKKEPNDWSTFVWDRIKKRYLWQDAMTSEPSAWSPNDKYLYCCDTIVEALTGKTVFEKLKGHRGKFSPDGRSLVTVDKEALYVYTLPKESEPIFGVFQKPEPWGPSKVSAQKPKDKAKTK